MESGDAMILGSWEPDLTCTEFCNLQKQEVEVLRSECHMQNMSIVDHHTNIAS
jgi:hypothetical protein